MRCTTAWTVLATCLCGMFACSVSANNIFSQRQRDAEEVFLLAPRPLVRLLREGELAIGQGRYADGVAALAVLLQDDNRDLPADLRGQDYFIESGRKGLFTKTVKGEATRLLANLPSDGRRILEIEYGVTARLELDQFIDQRDFVGVSSVARRYPHTEAGYDAQILVARQKLADGFPRAAASIFDALLTYPAARARYGVELVKASALCWMHAGMPKSAVATLESAVATFPDSSIGFHGRQVTVARSTDWETIVSNAMTSEPSLSDTRPAESWLGSGGGPARNAVADAGLPLPNARWVKEINSSVPEKESLLELAETELHGDRVILPKFELRIFGDLVLTKTTDSEILAVDFETGLTNWPFYHNSVPTKLKNHRFELSSTGATSELSPELQSRVWGSTAFGRFSCDPERLYFVTAKRHRRIDPRTFRVDRPANLLQGVSIPAQGKIEWQVGGSIAIGSNENRTSEPKLKGAYFLGPPLSYEGDLYVIVDINGETRLTVLDPTTGTVRWEQQLIHPINHDLKFDVARRDQAISPTIADGVILCPTGAGAVVAVDLLSRRLLWGTSYGTIRGTNLSRIRGGVMRRFSSIEYKPLAARWQDDAMISQDGMFVMSPPESNDFFCRDIRTGRSILSRQNRGDGRYIAGIRDGHVYVVAERNIYCYGTRKPNAPKVWEVAFPNRHTLAGKGLWLSDSMIVPLSGNTLIQVSLDDGSILETATVDQPVGNLFAHRGNLLSISPTSVAAYYTAKKTKHEVRQRLASNPRDVWALNQSSQLAIAKGNVDEAFRLLSESYDIDSSNVETRYLLIETMLAGLQVDFGKYESLASDFEGLVEYTPQRSLLLQWLALGNIRAGQYLSAFSNLMELMRDRAGSHRSGSQVRAREMRLSELHSVDTDTWIATELARSYQAADAQLRTRMDARVEKELSSVGDVVVPMRRQKLKFFAWHPSAEKQILATAISLLDRDEQTAGEQMLMPLRYSEKPDTRAVAEKLLGRPTSSDNLEFGPQGRVFSSLYERDNLSEELEGVDAKVGSNLDRTKPVQWNAGMMRVAATQERELYPSGLRMPQIAERFGRPDIDVRLSGGRVVIYNSCGEEVTRLEYSRGSSDNSNVFTRAILRGGLLIIETSSEVVGMDLYRGLADGREAVLWRQSLQFPNTRYAEPRLNPVNLLLGVQINRRSANGRKTTVGPLTPSGLILQLGTSIVSIDPYTGRQMWARDGYDSRVRLAHQDTKLAIVSPSLGRVEIVDCRDGAVIEQYKYRGNWKHWWFTHGSLVVDYGEVPDDQVGSSGIISEPTMKPVLHVWDAVSGQDFLTLELPRGSSANVCEGRYLVVLEPESKLHFFDLQERKYVQHDVDVDSNLTNIQVERFGDRLIVLGNSKPSQPPKNLPNLAKDPLDNHKVNGYVYALDLNTDELLWERPGSLFHMYFPRTQPRNSPFMVTYRVNPSVQRPRLQGRPALMPATASIALIDLRSGRLAYSTRGMPLRIIGNGFAMLLIPRQQMIKMSLGATNLVFRATRGEIPPQPIVHYGHIRAVTPEKKDSMFDFFR